MVKCMLCMYEDLGLIPDISICFCLHVSEVGDIKLSRKLQLFWVHDKVSAPRVTFTIKRAILPPFLTIKICLEPQNIFEPQNEGTQLNLNFLIIIFNRLK